MAVFTIRLSNDPRKHPPWIAFAYQGEIDHSAQFLPGADFTAHGESKEAALAALSQMMKAWLTREPDEYLGLMWDESGEPVGLVA